MAGRLCCWPLAPWDSRPRAWRSPVIGRWSGLQSGPAPAEPLRDGDAMADADHLAAFRPSASASGRPPKPDVKHSPVDGTVVWPDDQPGSIDAAVDPTVIRRWRIEFPRWNPAQKARVDNVQGQLLSQGDQLSRPVGGRRPGDALSIAATSLPEHVLGPEDLVIAVRDEKRTISCAASMPDGPDRVPVDDMLGRQDRPAVMSGGATRPRAPCLILGKVHH
jgi:hypothetical protein